MDQNNGLLESDEIDLIAAIQKVWGRRRFILIITVISAFLGITRALTSQNIFTASSTFIPKSEDQGSIGGNLSGLASIAGINLGGMQKAQSGIPPQLYPRLIRSTPFIKSLLKINIPHNGKYISFKNYLTLQEDNNLLQKIIKYPLQLKSRLKLSLLPKEKSFVEYRNIGIQKFTAEEHSIYNSIRRNIISIIIDDKEGFVTLSVNLKHPETAAFVAKKAQMLLQKEIINFKIKNTQEQLTFTEKLCEEKKIKFEYLQDALAKYQDQNLNISSGTFQNTVNRLKAEVSVSGAVYEELAKQVEQARIQVIKDTPIFTIIDPVVIPNSRTSPKRTLIVIIWTSLGLVLSIGYLLIKDPIGNLLSQIFNSK